MTQKKENNKKAFLKAMEKTFGNVTQSCKLIGIDRTLPYKWAENDEAFAEKFKSNKWGEMFLDMVEDGLTELAQDEKNPTVLIFLAKTKGKKRGYIERQEITGAAGEPTAFKIEIIDRSKDTNK